MTTGIDLIGSCKMEKIDMTVNALSAVISFPKRTKAAKVALMIKFGVIHNENIERDPQINLG